jgi:hypothetical protein
MAEPSTSVPELNLADALQRGIGSRLDRRFTGVHRRIYFAVGLVITALAAGGFALWSEFRDLKAELARAGADTKAVREQAADQKARLDMFGEKLDKSLVETIRTIRELAEQTTRLNTLSDKAGKNLAETTHAIQEFTVQTTRMDTFGEKLDKHLAETTRAIRELADQTARMDTFGEKLDKNLTETMRSLQEAATRVKSAESTPALGGLTRFGAMTLSEGEREIIRKFFGVRRKLDAVRFEAKVGDIAPETAPLYPVPSLLYKDVPKIKDHRFFADEANGTIILVRPADNRIVAIV